MSYAEITRLSRAGMRRFVALAADGQRFELRDVLCDPQILGPVPLADAERRLADYVLDRCARPLSGALDDPWFEQSLLLSPLAPGHARPMADDVAAIVAAPHLVSKGSLTAAAYEARFTSRGDTAIAAALCRLDPPRASETIRALAEEAGPDEAVLHLALVQAGAALAWQPALATSASGVIERLLALLDRASPEPLLAAIAPSLGALAAADSPVAAHVREQVVGRLAAARERIAGRGRGAMFFEEFLALDKQRAIPDEDYYLTLPDRQLAVACARVLGRAAAGEDRDGFIALQARVLVDDFASTLLPPFVDGLIDAAAVAPLAELGAHLVASIDLESRMMGLYIASQLPLDDCAGAIDGCFDDRRASVRLRAVGAAAMLPPTTAVPALITRLDDSEPAVCAAAARALVELGQADEVAARRMPGELAIGHARERTAAARAAIGDTSPEVVSTLLALASEEAERNGDQEDAPTPLAHALATALRGSAHGMVLTADLVREIPEALPVLALALAGPGDAPVVSLAPELRERLRAALAPIIDAGGEPSLLAIEVLSRFSLGDAALVDRVIAAGERDGGYAQLMLTALSHLRVRSDRAAEVLAPWLEERTHLAATVAAAGVAGLVLPPGHALWGRVRELLELGTIAGGTAYTALANGVRIRC